MSRNFLLILLLLTAAGLLWGAQGDSGDGATADNTVDNNDSSARMAVSERGRPSGIIRLPYLVLRTVGRMPARYLRMLARLPRDAAIRVAQSLSRLMAALKNFATDALGYLARSERTELTRVRRSVPMTVTASKANPPRGGINVPFLIFKMVTYPIKTAYRTTYGALHFSPLAGTLNLISSVLSKSGFIFNMPVVRQVNNATKQMFDYVAAGAWNFTKSTILPQLDGFVTNLKDTNSLPDSLMAMLTELQTLYHIFKFLGMA